MAYNYEYPYTDPDRHNDDWAFKKIKELLNYMVENTEWVKHHEEEYQELKNLYDAVMAGNFPESIIEAFEKWMRENANELVGQMVKNVFFEINDNGYFVANVPESWSDITFNTSGLDIEIEGLDYGHLILSY